MILESWTSYLDKNSEDPNESAYYLSVNRNKHSVTLDLTKKEGQSLAKDIIKKCDVLVENFRPGNLKQYGLDYKSIKKLIQKLSIAQLLDLVKPVLTHQEEVMIILFKQWAG